jgi:hypothetical protein
LKSILSEFVRGHFVPHPFRPVYSGLSLQKGAALYKANSHLAAIMTLGQISPRGMNTSTRQNQKTFLLVWHGKHWL